MPRVFLAQLPRPHGGAQSGLAGRLCAMRAEGTACKAGYPCSSKEPCPLQSLQRRWTPGPCCAVQILSSARMPCTPSAAAHGCLAPELDAESNCVVTVRSVASQGQGHNFTQARPLDPVTSTSGCGAVAGLKSLCSFFSCLHIGIKVCISERSDAYLSIKVSFESETGVSVQQILSGKQVCCCHRTLRRPWTHGWQNSTLC